MPQMYLRQTSQFSNKPKRHKRQRTLLLLFGVVVFLVGWLIIGSKTANSPEPPANKTTLSEPSSAPNTTTSVQEKQLPNIQVDIDKFVASHQGTYAVKITSQSGTVLAEHNGDKGFFTASIYKLFVAYAGYQKIDDGTHQLSESYLAGYTRGGCLDAMIRDSYSPCAEKLWEELGKESLTKQMQKLGLTNTSLTGLVTSANDSAMILQRIAKGDGLSEASKGAYLDSMKTQDSKYRRGLPTGFKQSTVYNKVGWNEDKEWHDTAIVVLPNGEKVIVTILTSGAGYKNVAQLGAVIEEALLK